MIYDMSSEAAAAQFYHAQITLNFPDAFVAEQVWDPAARFNISEEWR